MLTTRRVWTLLLTLGVLLAGMSASAAARTEMRTVSYRGYAVTVPRSWPVYRLAPGSRTCVRFNRHAVYLGQPGADQACPVNSAGRSEAILIQPAAGAASGLSGSGVGRLAVRRDGVVVTATWRSDPAVIRAALHLRSLTGVARAASRPAHSDQPATRGRVTRIRSAERRATVSSSAPATPGAVFNGTGFDACSTPSESTMSAWGSSSPYGGIGIYIGGVNMACSQPNLNSSWVTTESAAGWHLAPIYVGEQAPTNSCGCASITPSQASAEGNAAAVDAADEAESVGIGTGNPIYYDMEAYSRTSTNSTAVLAFLEAWTEELHSEGFLSGVYSSDSSGIADLASEVGTGYVEPDDIWVAAWNGEANTQDSTIPTGDWSNNQRLHQYQGANNETYGGVTINVDNDDFDAATAAAGGGATAAPVTTVPSASAPPTTTGTPVVGQTLTELRANWSGSPTGYADQWWSCDTRGGDCVAIAGATGQTYTLTSADVGRIIFVAETAANAVGTSAVADSQATPAVARSAAGYWAFTATGAVDNSVYEVLWGSPSTVGLKDFVGMASTPGRLGYWMVTRYGSVYAFGNARRDPRIRIAHPVVGIAAASNLGYWLVTSGGNVYASRGAGFYGSPADLHLDDIVGMAPTPSRHNGYWLVTWRGTVLNYGAAEAHPTIHPSHPIIGIVAAPAQGYWLYSASGYVYPSAGTRNYGSPRTTRDGKIVSMLATPDGRGYWMITSTGTVFSYGDAAKYPDPTVTSGAVVGMAG